MLMLPVFCDAKMEGIISRGYYSVSLSGLAWHVKMDMHVCKCTPTHLKLSEQTPSPVCPSSWFSSSARSSSLMASVQKGWLSNSGQHILGKTVEWLQCSNNTTQLEHETYQVWKTNLPRLWVFGEQPAQEIP